MKYVIDVFVKILGVIFNIVVDEIGIVVMLFGVGCVMKEDEIDLVVGLMLCKKVGDVVKEGELFVIIYVNCENVEDVKVKIYENIFIVEIVVVFKLVYIVIID